jgi:hypothetical protein
MLERRILVKGNPYPKPSSFASATKQSIFASERKNELLRRFRLRSLSYGGQVAPRNGGKTWMPGKVEPRSRLQHHARRFPGLKRVLDKRAHDCKTALNPKRQRKR